MTPDLMSWDGWFNLDDEEDEKITDELHNYMTGKMDYTGNYSIGIENLDGYWYIYMNLSKEYKELTGLQYDADYHMEKSIEWNKQTEAIKEAVSKRYENELRGEWVYNWGGKNNEKTVIRNIKIDYIHRDRITGEINFSYNYTAADYEGTENNWYMSVKIKHGRIENVWTSNKFNGTAESSLNEDISSYICQLIPEFHYLPE